MVSDNSEKNKNDDDASKGAVDDNVRSIVEKAAASAEELVATIREKAIEEARGEAEKIISDAKKTAAEVIRQAEETARKLEMTRDEMQPDNLETDVVEEKPVVSGQEHTVLETENTATKIETEKTETPVSQINTQALFSGEVELTIPAPANLGAVSKLYNYLRESSDMKIISTKGSWDRGTTLKISIGKPLPIIGMIASIPGISVRALRSEDDKTDAEAAGPASGTKAEQPGRIILELKDE